MLRGPIVKKRGIKMASKAYEEKFTALPANSQARTFVSSARVMADTGNGDYSNAMIIQALVTYGKTLESVAGTKEKSQRDNAYKFELERAEQRAGAMIDLEKLRNGLTSMKVDSNGDAIAGFTSIHKTASTARAKHVSPPEAKQEEYNRIANKMRTLAVNQSPDAAWRMLFATMSDPTSLVSLEEPWIDHLLGAITTNGIGTPTDKESRRQYDILRRNATHAQTVRATTQAGLDQIREHTEQLVARINNGEQLDLNRERESLRRGIESIGSNIGDMMAPDKDQIEAEVNKHHAEDPITIERQERLDRVWRQLESMLGVGGAGGSSSMTMSPRQQMGLVIADQEFQDFAKARGFAVGKAEVGKDGKPSWYAMGRQDMRAIKAFNRAIVNPKFRPTGEIIMMDQDRPEVYSDDDLDLGDGQAVTVVDKGMDVKPEEVKMSSFDPATRTGTYNTDVIIGERAFNINANYVNGEVSELEFVDSNGVKRKLDATDDEDAITFIKAELKDTEDLIFVVAKDTDLEDVREPVAPNARTERATNVRKDADREAVVADAAAIESKVRTNRINSTMPAEYNRGRVALTMGTQGTKVGGMSSTGDFYEQAYLEGRAPETARRANPLSRGYKPEMPMRVDRKLSALRNVETKYAADPDASNVLTTRRKVAQIAQAKEDQAAAGTSSGAAPPAPAVAATSRSRRRPLRSLFSPASARDEESVE
jgi:hypothetical protein